MNQYYFSDSENRHIAVRLNGVKFALPSHFNRVAATKCLRERARYRGIPVLLPQVLEDKTTGYKKLYFVTL